MTRRQFEALVEKALRRLPKQFKSKIANIAVVVEDWADDETLADVGIEPPDKRMPEERLHAGSRIVVALAQDRSPEIEKDAARSLHSNQISIS